MSKSRVDWVWAVPPSDELRAFAQDLVRGELPSEGCHVIKQNRPRTVWQLPHVAGGLLVKHYRVQRKDAVRALVTPGRAEREYRAMESLCSWGLPTVRPLGYADHRQGVWLKEAWFIGRLVKDAQTLAESLAASQALSTPSLPTAGRRDPWTMALRAAGVVAQLHEHRVWHRDLHAGNLLLGPDDQLLIIDLHSMWRVPRVTRSMRTGNLAHLLHSMRTWINLDDAPRFVAEYAQARGERADELIPHVRRALQAFEADYVRGRSARCMRNSTEFLGRALPEGRVHRLRHYELDTFRADLRRHAEIVSQGGPELLGDAPRCRVSLMDGSAPEGSAPRAGRVVKQYLDHGFYPSLRSRLGWGKARSAWKAARRCQVEGVPTPTALALLERPDGSAFTVTDEVPDALSLETFADRLGPGSEPTLRHQVAWQVGHVVGRLSRAGLRHDDMSTKNLLIAPWEAAGTGDLRTNPPVGMPEILLIDLDNMVRTAAHDPGALVRMLGQLGDVPEAVTRTDLGRFARGFRSAAGRALPTAVVVRAAALTRVRQARRASLERAVSAGSPG